MSEISGQNLKLNSLSPMMILSLFGFGVLLVSLSIAISVGAVPVSLKTVLGVLINKFIPNFVEPTWSMGHEAIIWEIRFPRYTGRNCGFWLGGCWGQFTSSD